MTIENKWRKTEITLLFAKITSCKTPKSAKLRKSGRKINLLYVFKSKSQKQPSGIIDFHIIQMTQGEQYMSTYKTSEGIYIFKMFGNSTFYLKHESKDKILLQTGVFLEIC